MGAERPQRAPKFLAKSPMFAIGADGSPVPFQAHRESEWMSITGSSAGEARSAWVIGRAGRSAGGVSHAVAAAAGTKCEG